MIFLYLLADDVTTIKSKYDIPILLLGDFNSRIGTLTDFEYEFKYDGSDFEVLIIL